MKRTLRVIERDVWKLCIDDEVRKDRLLKGSDPVSLVERVGVEATRKSKERPLNLVWQHSCESPGYYRLWTQIELSEDTFDELFNGHAGYRAQYYLSPEEGILYNRDIISALLNSVQISYENSKIDAEFELIETSLLAPHSKVWIYGEKKAFDEAGAKELNPPRWVENNATRGRKVPLPKHLQLDLKGTFIHPENGSLFIDELKLDRACDLYAKGYT